MRSKSEIQNDYMGACAALGDVTYRIACFQEEADKLHSRIHNLNLEEQKRAAKQGTEVSIPEQAPEVVEAANE